MDRLRRTLAHLGARLLTTRWLVRMPITLYRIGLGFLFGTRLLMLEHIGRKSGARRFVVLEVVERPGPGDYVIVSGFGASAQWYRNILAQPAVRVSCGLHRHRAATAIPMTADESAAALDRYAHAHPRAWTRLRAVIEAAADGPVQGLPMVRLHLGPHHRD